MAKPGLAAQRYAVREHAPTAIDFATGMKKVRDIGYRVVQISTVSRIPPAELKAILDDPDDVIEQHRVWDCKNVAIGSMPTHYREEGEAGFTRFTKEVNHVGEQLAAEGLSFS